MQRPLATLLDLLFPPRCIGCRVPGTDLCARCLTEIERFEMPRCRRCDLPLGTQTAGTGACKLCRPLAPGDSAIDGLRVVGPHRGLLRQAVHALKYSNRRHIARPLAALLTERWKSVEIEVAGVIPVPLHPARLRERGYNQSHLLAEPFASASSLPLRTSLLQRVRPTPPQVGLDRPSRFKNVAGAFAADEEAAGGAWLLIDDVCTTAATLEACARALRQAGATAVWALTLARSHGDFHEQGNQASMAAIG